MQGGCTFIITKMEHTLEKYRQKNIELSFMNCLFVIKRCIVCTNRGLSLDGCSCTHCDFKYTKSENISPPKAKAIDIRNGRNI